MLPITNQVQTRASPVPVQPTRVVETTAPISASAQLDIPPVEEADSAADTFQRGQVSGDLALRKANDRGGIADLNSLLQRLTQPCGVTRHIDLNVGHDL